MGIMVYSLLWVMQDFVHQPYEGSGFRLEGLAFRCSTSVLQPRGSKYPNSRVPGPKVHAPKTLAFEHLDPKP